MLGCTALEAKRRRNTRIKTLELLLKSALEWHRGAVQPTRAVDSSKLPLSNGLPKKKLARACHQLKIDCKARESNMDFFSEFFG